MCDPFVINDVSVRQIVEILLPFDSSHTLQDESEKNRTLKRWKTIIINVLQFNKDMSKGKNMLWLLDGDTFLVWQKRKIIKMLVREFITQTLVCLEGENINLFILFYKPCLEFVCFNYAHYLSSWTCCYSFVLIFFFYSSLLLYITKFCTFIKKVRNKCDVHELYQPQLICWTVLFV